MKNKGLNDLPLLTRRRLLTAIAASPFAAAYGHQGILKAADILLGSGTAYAAAASTPVKYFIEINLRDQWDFMHFIVPPGLATNSNLKRAESGEVGKEENRLLALYQDPKTLTKGANNIYLTDDSKEILPHVGNIAAVETIELCIGGIHGHEAANGMRSPGRGYKEGPGKKAMWLGDDANQTDAGGDEFFYSSSPTPALVHLNVARQLNATARAVALKFLGRADKKHSVYHFPADLSDNGFLRVQSREQLIQGFAQAKPVDPLSSSEATIVGQLLKQLDASYLKQMKYTGDSIMSHEEHQNSFLARTAKGLQVLDLTLSAEEKEYWSKNVPPESSTAPRMHLWEQCAMASKLIAADAVTTVAMEFSFDDLHGGRPKKEVTAQGKIVGMCLARLIADLKAKNLWDDTMIFINTTDGGREPYVDSYGDKGKNSMILAGGRVQGGYYGDIRVAKTDGNVHTYSYHVPEIATGRAVAQGSTDNNGRISNAVAYRTIMQAMGAPASIYQGLPDVGKGDALGFMLKS